MKVPIYYKEAFIDIDWLDWLGNQKIQATVNSNKEIIINGKVLVVFNKRLINQSVFVWYDNVFWAELIKKY